MDPQDDDLSDGHTLFNLRANLNLTHGVELVGRIMNLTDRHYAERATFNAFHGAAWLGDSTLAVACIDGREREIRWLEGGDSGDPHDGCGNLSIARAPRRREVMTSSRGLVGTPPPDSLLRLWGLLGPGIVGIGFVRLVYDEPGRKDFWNRQASSSHRPPSAHTWRRPRCSRTFLTVG